MPNLTGTAVGSFNARNAIEQIHVVLLCYSFACSPRARTLYGMLRVWSKCRTLEEKKKKDAINIKAWIPAVRK